jgi:hypothetical protein
MKDQPYIHGENFTRTPPLGSYLPHIQTGVVQNWLINNLVPSDWILCPFGSSPQAALEAARAGFRVLLPVHNPILRFLINKLADPPLREDLNSALVKLASSYKGKERLKPHILSLYETDCPLCGHSTSAVSFIWSKASRKPLRKICRCSACGEESLTEITDADLTKALAFREQSPTHARALTRVTSPTDPIRVQVENALATYPPRSVYALFTALNKVTGFSLSAEERANLDLILLHAFYLCSQSLGVSTYGDSDRETFREENVWFAMEDALESWIENGPPIPVTSWPDEPPEEGGICIFPGRIKELTPQLIGFPIRGLVMVYPRPTPEFWSLSALWSGWLWGQDAAAPLRGILSSRDLDWSWLVRASQITLQELGEALPDQIPVMGLMPGVEKESLLAWTTGALAADLECKSLILDPDNNQGQSYWVLNPSSGGSRGEYDHKALIREAGLEALKNAGEPSHTLTVYSAGIIRLAEAGYPDLANQMEDAAEHYSKLLVDFEENIAYRQGFLHYPKIDAWWHQELVPAPLPQSDQVEIDLVRILLESSASVKYREIFQELYKRFTGPGKPRTNLVEACLKSYADQDPAHSNSWILRTCDQPANRIQDLREMEEIIRSIGKELGYQTRTDEVPENLTLVIWELDGAIVERFFVSASGLLHKIIKAGGLDSESGWIILPGSRAGLIHYKMRHNPILADIIEENWQLIKYRHLRRLAEQGGLTRENYQDRFCLDPFTSDSPQIPLI